VGRSCQTRQSHASCTRGQATGRSPSQLEDTVASTASIDHLDTDLVARFGGVHGRVFNLDAFDRLLKVSRMTGDADAVANVQRSRQVDTSNTCLGEVVNDSANVFGPAQPLGSPLSAPLPGRLKDRRIGEACQQ
jgi:hypothetical protein